MAGQYKFPVEYDQELDAKPLTAFRCNEGPMIMMPTPAGISFSDGATYGQLDLKMAGNDGMEVVNAAKKQLGNAAEAVSNRGDWKKAAAKALDKAVMSGVASTFQDVDKFALAQHATKKIMNPNANTTFQGVSIRSFSFEFLLVGRTRRDTDAIRNIHNAFREFMYPAVTPDTGNILLSFPPIWNIFFYDVQGKKNKFIPHIDECYLTGMSTSFNPSNNMYKTDYSPVETSLSLTFQETRALLRSDIQVLNAGQAGIA